MDGPGAGFRAVHPHPISQAPRTRLSQHKEPGSRPRRGAIRGLCPGCQRAARTAGAVKRVESCLPAYPPSPTARGPARKQEAGVLILAPASASHLAGGESASKRYVGVAPSCRSPEGPCTY